MNANPLIVSALSPLNMPVEPNVYLGTAAEYIVFNYVLEDSALFADDTDINDETTIRVNYFTKSNPKANTKIIRRLLREAGFSIASTQELYESDTAYTHVIIEVNISGVIDD